MIDLGPQNRKALGLLARARVLEHFPIRSVIARYEGLYETVLAGEASAELVAPATPRIAVLSPTFEKTGAQ
jgi:hypothetical protein